MNVNDNDDEKELILGNRQLLGIFFVATLLCGVFFAMGYVVGGNSAKSGTAAAASTDSTAGSVSDNARADPRSLPAGNSVGAPPATSDPVTPSPAGGSGTPDSAGTQAPTAGASPSTGTVSTADGSIDVSEPVKGASYLQVAAEKRPQADELVKTLRKRDLPAILAESPIPSSFRVLVGPYRSTVTLADAKSTLKSLGFDGVFVQSFGQ